MFRANPLSEEKLRVEFSEVVFDCVERPSLLADEVDDESRDALAWRENASARIPSRLPVDEIGDPELPTEGGDKGSRAHRMSENRPLDIVVDGNGRKIGPQGNPLTEDGHRTLREDILPLAEAEGVLVPSLAK